MIDPNNYEGREQTYIKHLILYYYLERVAYNIFSFSNNFVYVDGFSGPWRSQGGSHDDTSFKIATERLRKICNDFRNQGKNVQFRSLFIEKDPKAFEELQEAVKNYDNVEIENGEFADNIGRIRSFVGNDFSFIFIDPTSFDGYPMDQIRPLLHLRGEVLINFMSDFVVRFIDDPRPNIATMFDGLFGSEWFEEWKILNSSGLSREAAAVEVYRRRLLKNSNFEFVTSTRVLKPLADRSYFHLFYGTENWKGILEFSSVEKKVVATQEQVRDAAKYKARIDRTKQLDMLNEAGVDTRTATFEGERNGQCQRGFDILIQELKRRDSPEFQDLIGPVLAIPLVWESDLKEWVRRLRDEGKITSPNWGSKQRVPHRKTVLKWAGPG